MGGIFGFREANTLRPNCGNILLLCIVNGFEGRLEGDCTYATDIVTVDTAELELIVNVVILNGELLHSPSIASTPYEESVRVLSYS